MSKLTRDQVLKLAHLSRLKLSEEEIERFREELAEILDYVKQLENADTKGLEPTYQVTGLKNVTRADKPLDYQAKPDDLLKRAPDTLDKQFKVKRVIT
ncbi:hypothetical protein A3F65_01845 [Candidatus Saccharibacteria bacterium RIFCSPHIGHO2_12_FULL_47_16b]|nr:MAG: hypothetical protein A3F65_01845 [Candidatus Saccharibacteria bacterium RIFCSPHIGHO2_12_FULL_47_16b]